MNAKAFLLIILTLASVIPATDLSACGRGCHGGPAGGSVVVRAGGIRGVAFGNVVRVRGPGGYYVRRRGGVRGLLFGGVDKGCGPYGCFVSRRGGARGVLFGGVDKYWY